MTNDFDDSKAMSCVIKISIVDGENVVKLSDDKGKHQGNEEKLKQVLDIINAV